MVRHINVYLHTFRKFMHLGSIRWTVPAQTVWPQAWQVDPHPCLGKKFPGMITRRETAASRAGHSTCSQLPSSVDVSQIEGTRWLWQHQPSPGGCLSQKLSCPSSLTIWRDRDVFYPLQNSGSYCRGTKTLCWRLTLEDAREERPLGSFRRPVVLLSGLSWTSGCEWRKVPALLVSLWLTDTLGTTSSFSIPALY